MPSAKINATYAAEQEHYVILNKVKNLSAEQRGLP
jgi:hypothetical protein